MAQAKQIIAESLTHVRFGARRACDQLGIAYSNGERPQRGPLMRSLASGFGLADAGAVVRPDTKRASISVAVARS